MKKILLVEDDSAIVDIYSTIIKKAGFDVEICSLGQEVLQKINDATSLNQTPPDLVLLDLILPDMNGIQVLEEIKKNSTTKNTLVFILTNQDPSQVKINSGLAPDKFIVKANISPSQLVEFIKKTLPN